MALTPLHISKFGLFSMTYLVHDMKVKCAKDHHQWFDVLGDRSKRRLLFEAGRGRAKSTFCTKHFTIFNACESDDEVIHIASRSGGKTGTAAKLMKKIRREFEENDLLIHDYGLTRGSEWGSEVLEVVRADGHRVTIYCVGKHSSIRGARGTIIIDDPQNEADCKSEAVLTADEDWFLGDVLPVMVQDQRCIFVATPISPVSLCETVKRLPSFEVYSFPAEDPVGSGISSWPEWQSNEYLAMQLADMGLDRYNAEYNCRPRVPGNPVFRIEWFKQYSLDDLPELRREFVYLVTGGDGAESKSSSADETALVTIAATTGTKPDFYITDVRHGHWTTKEGAEQVLQVFSLEQQHKTVLETRVKPKSQQAGDAWIDDVQHLEHIYGKYVNLYPVRPEADKVTRARYVQGICQEGRVYYDPTNKAHQWLINQLTMFTGDQQFHDDGVDAFVMALTDHKDNQRNELVQNGPQVVLPGRRRSVSGMV